MSEKIVWKRFVLKDTFKRTPPPSTKSTAKMLDIYDAPFDNSIALITRAEKNNGIRGYIEKGDFETLKKGITYNDQFSFFLYHEYEFTTIKDHLSVIVAINPVFQKILEKHSFVNYFITGILNRVFTKEIFDFNFTGADYRYEREVFLLPCIECDSGDSIVEEGGKSYTLAVDYIKTIMSKTKVLKEKKTIKVFKTNQSYFIEEQKKFVEAYQSIKNNIIWKSVKLGSFSELSTDHTIKKQIKNLQIFETHESGTIANVTASKENNGIVGYIEENEEISKSKVKNVLTIAPDAAYAGKCFFQEDYVVSTGHNKMIKIIDDKYKARLDSNKYTYLFLASILTKQFCQTFYGFSKSITDGDYEATPILLPFIKTTQDRCVLKEGKEYFDLAVDYISYLYLQGKVNYYNKLVDNYKYQY